MIGVICKQEYIYLSVSGSTEPSADSTKIEITHCNTLFLPFSNKCLTSDRCFLFCEELQHGEALTWVKGSTT